MTLFHLIILKRKLEEMIMWPFILYGRYLARKNPLPASYDIFFFFPIYGLGGAEKVNAQIVQTFADKKVIIFFTKHSPDDSMLSIFKGAHVTIRDISRYTDNKSRYWQSFIYRGICSGYIHGQVQPPIVFNGQCNFAYKLFPHLSPTVKTFELIHTADLRFSRIVFPYVPFIGKRIMITDSLMKCHLKYYREIGVPPEFDVRMVRINNMVNTAFASGPRSTYGDRLNICYAGRGGKQKRLWLLFEIMRRCMKEGLPVDFHMAGNFDDEIPEDLKGRFQFYGMIRGEEKINHFFSRMDLLLLTSQFEGFPLVMAEAMINGVVPIATPVDGIPENIKHGENGFLLDNQNEESVITSAVELIRNLDGDRLRPCSAQASAYILSKYSQDEFEKNYRSLLGFGE